ncbi:G-protein coupled receptor 157 isoform X2 [Macaca fascicularis]|uniref:G protein-coupled receptor 157 n=1 Tax=Macaca fascicularis TaxID=9541 RepID=A0A2K5TW29_MACFA
MRSAWPLPGPLSFSGGGDAAVPSVWDEPSSPDPGLERRVAAPGPGGTGRKEDPAAGSAWACLGLFRAGLLLGDRADRGHLEILRESCSQAPGQERPGNLHYLLAPSQRAPSWGIPLVITVAAVALKKIGYDASDVSVGWCWIDLEAKDHVLWMLLTGKLWEMLAYILLPLLYLLVRKHINRAHMALSEYRPILSEEHRLPRRCSVADKKLVLIPLIFICLRVWSTVRFVLTLCDSPAVQTPVLVVLHGIGNTFQGGANCIMFVLCTRAVRTRLFSLCCWCCSSQPPTKSPAGTPKAPTPSKPGESQEFQGTPGELPST